MRVIDHAVLLSLLVTVAAWACNGESEQADEPAAGKGGASGSAGKAGAPAGGKGGSSGANGGAGGAGSTAAGSGGTSGASASGGTAGATGGDASAGNGANGASAGDASAGGSGGAAAGGDGGLGTAAASGEDGSGGAPTGLVNCDPRVIVCRRAAPVCDDGEVPSVSGTCFGPCVPIARCECDEPEDCPNEATYTCHNAPGHCDYYVR